jgi:hypothetical protein
LDRIVAPDQNSIKIANDSGFPLQIAVETSVSQSSTSHGWKVRYTEHSWSNRADGDSGFIDLILQDKHKTTFLIVECKRKSETWLFLRSDGTAKASRHAKAWVSHYSDGTMKRFGWTDVAPDPECPEVGFCATRGMSANDKTTMLERIGGELLSSTEAFASEEKDFRRPKQENLRFYFNVVVTTAQLKLATFDPHKVSLTTGTLDEAEIQDVPFVRFRKQLSVRPAQLTPGRFEEDIDPSYEKENTIFVVRADHFVRFLHEFGLPEEEFRTIRYGG